MCTGAEGMMVAGMGMQAAGAYSNSSNAKGAYGAQSQVASNNAQIARWQAQDALARGDRAAIQVRTKGNQLKGAQRAAMAANGVDVGTGSALDILTDTDFTTALDANTVKDNAAKEAWALRNQAAGFTADSSILNARADAENPTLALGGSLLTSAGKAGAYWNAKPAAGNPGLGVPGFSAMGTYG